MARAALIAGNAPIHWPGRHGGPMVTSSQTTRTAIGSPDLRGRARMRRRKFIAGLGGAAALHRGANRKVGHGDPSGQHQGVVGDRGCHCANSYSPVGQIRSRRLRDRYDRFAPDSGPAVWVAGASELGHLGGFRARCGSAQST